nr:MAG TPA: hypothetical protein [Caudoviricetes sp.]
MRSCWLFFSIMFHLENFFRSRINRTANGMI